MLSTIYRSSAALLSRRFLSTAVEDVAPAVVQQTSQSFRKYSDDYRVRAVCVSNLPKSATKVNSLKSIFSDIGSVEFVDMAYAKTDAHLCRLSFSNAAEAFEAVKTMNNHKIDENEIKVHFGLIDPLLITPECVSERRVVKIDHLPRSFSYKDMVGACRELIGSFSNINWVFNQNDFTAYVVLDTPEQAQSCMESFRSMINSDQVVIELANDWPYLDAVIANVPGTYDQASFARKLNEVYGLRVQFTKLVSQPTPATNDASETPEKRQLAFVTLANPSAHAILFDKINGSTELGNTLYVSLDRPERNIGGMFSKRNSKKANDTSSNNNNRQRRESAQASE